jgi:hypothetical protein
MVKCLQYNSKESNKEKSRKQTGSRSSTKCNGGDRNPRQVTVRKIKTDETEHWRVYDIDHVTTLSGLMFPTKHLMECIKVINRMSKFRFYLVFVWVALRAEHTLRRYQGRELTTCLIKLVRDASENRILMTSTARMMIESSERLVM